MSTQLQRAIRRSRWLLVAAAAVLASAASAQQTAHKVAPTDAPRVAKLALVDQVSVQRPTTTQIVATGPAASRVAPNPRLTEATCKELHVSRGAPGARVFDDGFEAGDLGAWQPSGMPTFSVRGALDLDFTAQLLSFDGEALLRVELTSPAGHHFQTLEVPVAAAASGLASPQTRAVTGYPHPISVRFALPAEDAEAGSLSVSVSWPLAGTHVVSHGLYGQWTVAASLVDAADPAGPSLGCPATLFTLQP